MAYSELIKNFEKVRAYMREFYVYGFKSRTEYDAKSAYEAFNAQITNYVDPDSEEILFTQENA